MDHPLEKFKYCPICGSQHFTVNDLNQNTVKSVDLPITSIAVLQLLHLSLTKKKNYLFVKEQMNLQKEHLILLEDL